MARTATGSTAEIRDEKTKPSVNLREIEERWGWMMAVMGGGVGWRSQDVVRVMLEVWKCGKVRFCMESAVRW